MASKQKELLRRMDEQREADLEHFMRMSRQVNLLINSREWLPEEWQIWRAYAEALGVVIGNETAVHWTLADELVRRQRQPNTTVDDDIWNRFYGIGRPLQTAGQIAADLSLSEAAINKRIQRMKKAGRIPPADKRKTRTKAKD
jgi:hypothetical protein